MKDKMRLSQEQAVQKVVMIIMRRDGEDSDYAVPLVRDTILEVEEALEAGESWRAEEIWQENLGLEPDYLLECLM